MTVYRFRVKFDPDPRALWRDVHIGADRTLDELQSTINEAFGLDNEHLWFIGDDESYWNSDVKYLSQQETETQAGAAVDQDRTEIAAETTVGELAEQFGIEQYERICYLYDYGDEWRFYAICKEVYDDPDDTAPTVGKQKGDPLEQYPDPETADSSLPEPIDTFPETPVAVADLEAVEDHDDVDHAVSLLTVETDSGPVSERFLIQYADVGYLLEHYPNGWIIVDEVDGTDKTETELLGELAATTREYHANITALASAALDDQADDETVDAMNVELEEALDARGYDQL